MSGRFDPGFEALPASLPIFPLTGVLLLPRGTLPLNIFEERYLAMTADALKGERFIGMVQPQEGAGDAGDPPVYRTGCAGRMISFSETDDGRYLITLTGVARFDITQELPKEQLYRRVVPAWEPYRDDLAPAAGTIDRARLLAALKPYLERHGIVAEWPAIEATPDDRLVTTVAMVAPFRPAEKQALLEAKDLAERARLLTALIEMAAHDGARAEGARH
ncbi:MAG TPA: LON peptidase substrate-binding domain-containing protein [Stellaceae bacterium]|jgi:Lon protease-like protein|nr:LON peptidase substrate-binding domain-containing protein [Stellaceae bacterium]